MKYLPVIVALCILTSVSESSQPHKVQGISGANILCLAQKGTSLFAGSSTGNVYRSDDGATTWTKLTMPYTPNYSSPCSQLLVVNDRILAGTHTGLYYSDDDGITWTQSPGVGVDVVGIAASASKIIAVTYGDGMSMSTDAGRTFSNYTDSLIGLNSQFRFAYSTGGDVYVGEYSFSEPHVFRSTNDGASWIKVNVPDLGYSMTRAGKRSFLGSTYDLFYSDDDWLTHSKIDLNLTNAYRTFYFYSTPKSVFVFHDFGILRSRDTGSTWTTLPFYQTTNSIIQSGSTLLAATYGGIFSSTDDGNTWQKSDKGITEIIPVSVVDVRNHLVLSTNSNGIFRSKDAGLTWNYLPSQFKTDINSQLAADDNGTLYAPFDGLYRSYDAGESWSLINTPHLHMYSLALCGKRLFYTDQNGDVYSADTSNFQFSSVGGVDAVAFLRNAGQRLFAFTGAGIQTSDDAGQTWTSRSKAVSYSFYAPFSFSVDGNTIFTNAYGQCLYSADAGSTWTSVLKNGSSNGAVIDGSKLIVGLSDALYTSTDHSTWSQSDKIFNDHRASISPLFVSNGNIFFSATADGIYYLSELSEMRELSMEDEDVVLYPNPAADQVSLSFKQPQHFVELSLADVLGNIVFTNIFTHSQSLNLPMNVVSGCYMLMIRTEVGTSTRIVRVVR